MAKSTDVLLIGIFILMFIVGCSANSSTDTTTEAKGTSVSSPPSPATPSRSADSRAETATATTEPTALPPTPRQPSPEKPQKLSSRLARLADPAVHTQDLERQAQLLSLPATGPGSLMRNDKNKVLVYIQLVDMSKENITVVKDTGADIIHVAEAFKTVTAYVAPAKLMALAELAVVEYIQEELMPE